MRNDIYTSEIDCEQCGKSYQAEGTSSGDGWNEPFEFEPFDEMCDSCTNGHQLTITIKVVGDEDFKSCNRDDWVALMEGFPETHVLDVEITKTKIAS